MEVFVTLGRDFIVAYQNEASARIDAVPVGVSVIKWTFLYSNEEVRDTIFGGKLLSCSNRLLSATAAHSCSLGTIGRCWGEMAKLSA